MKIIIKSKKGRGKLLPNKTFFVDSWFIVVKKWEGGGGHMEYIIVRLRRQAISDFSWLHWKNLWNSSRKGLILLWRVLQEILVIYQNSPSPCLQFLVPFLASPFHINHGFCPLPFPMNMHETEDFYFETKTHQRENSENPISTKSPFPVYALFWSRVVLSRCALIRQMNLLLPSSEVNLIYI